MLKNLAIAAVVVGVLSAGDLAVAQNQRPFLQPGPEVKKLDYFVGDNTTEGTLTVGTTSGKFTAKDHSEWLKGGFFVVNRSEFMTPFGPGGLVEIMGYDVTRKVYTHDSYNNAGMHLSSTGTVDGDTWTWTGTDGRSRHTVRILSPSTASYKTEISQDGTSWATLSEGTITKSN